MSIITRSMTVWKHCERNITKQGTSTQGDSNSSSYPRSKICQGKKLREKNGKKQWNADWLTDDTGDRLEQPSAL